ncbi:TPA: hypothetical protein DDZ86_03400 [Candidatus Dependentiae bacterium]|nr:MAG: hypothetical protein UW09_C0003G0032 [candidate division TM6 bacterium GW2011_GWF2_43_87]HBL98661.1 hypothetical protein [Candidatus Dependentiae bacterium]
MEKKFLGQLVRFGLVMRKLFFVAISAGCLSNLSAMMADGPIIVLRSVPASIGVPSVLNVAQPRGFMLRLGTSFKAMNTWCRQYPKEAAALGACGVALTGLVALGHLCFAISDYGRATLKDAYRTDKRRLVRYLEWWNAYLLARDRRKFIKACVRENAPIERIRFLVERGEWHYGFSRSIAKPISLAVRAGRLDVVTLLINSLPAGIDISDVVNWQDSDGNLPLYYAVDRNDLPMIGYLQGKGALISTNIPEGLKSAAYRDNDRKLKVFLKAGVSGLVVGKNIIEFGSADLLKIFGQDGNVISAADLFALFRYTAEVGYAISEKEMCQKVQALVEDLGMDLKFTDNDQCTALHYAAEHSRMKDVIKYLLSKGGDVDAKDGDGLTPLHHAIKCKQLRAFKALCKHGKPDFGIETRDGLNYLEYLKKAKINFSGYSVDYREMKRILKGKLGVAGGTVNKDAFILFGGNVSGMGFAFKKMSMTYHPDKLLEKEYKEFYGIINAILVAGKNFLPTYSGVVPKECEVGKENQINPYSNFKTPILDQCAKEYQKTLTDLLAGNDQASSAILKGLLNDELPLTKSMVLVFYIMNHLKAKSLLLSQLYLPVFIKYADKVRNELKCKVGESYFNVFDDLEKAYFAVITQRLAKASLGVRKKAREVVEKFVKDESSFKDHERIVALFDLLK